MKANFFFLVSFVTSLTQNPLLAQPVLPINADEIDPISQHFDTTLQIALQCEIDNNKNWTKLVNKKLLSIGIVDLSDTEHPRYAGLNDDHMMYAASLPKIAILLAAMDAIDEGELEYTPEIRTDLRLMISKSNNKASTRMIDRLGYDKIEAVLRAPKRKLYDEDIGGGLWVGKRYASGGERRPDPMKGISHAATTRQVCSFYYQLVMGNLVSTERSKEMLEIMKNPSINHKFVNTLRTIAPRAKLYRKSGSWQSYHSDSVLVWGPQRQYIMVALVHDGLGENIIRNLVKPLEKVLLN